MSATIDFYLTQAEKCDVDAAGTKLVQVRDRSLRAAAAWRAMADKLIRAETARAEKERQIEAARNAAKVD
ncbi:hypothetical protein [Sphingopyxis granuli]|jgi:hypothetical protein|uniref:Uncharacterized protein n=1 Tax=Sphingopyxis granuli TaxID=267128 RepID=A0AA86GPQ8_9SPHN|nr:hypothetical protein [Sphingopyxis granuli]AMG75635.1 Uncharacterized protein SGRAN_3292 [Sphingopyxis granuli]QUM73772.1 hypothetical protein ICN83_07890 [Sphingopyxis granuli]